MKPHEAADRAADDAVRAATIAQREAKKAAAAKQDIDTRFPTEHEQMVQALAGREQAALLRIGPKRNRWTDLAAFEDELAEIEQRRTALLEEIGALNLQVQEEPARHTAALASWMETGEQGERPASRIPELQAALADRQAEYEASGLRYDRLLRQRAEHVARNRRAMSRDVRKAKEKAAKEYAELVDAAEEKRRELLDLRATEVWAGLFPSELLSNEPNTQAIVGAKKSVQEPLLPGVQAGLVASAVFELLRADARFCESVATTDQFAALEGVSTARLTGREAAWQEGEPDIVGPRFEAAWSGSAEEAAEAERAKRYAESMRRRLWGE
jgi:hypothetical protein